MTDWILVPVAYLAGSLPWGLYVVQITKRVDVRTVGSGKIGATNVLRTAGKTAAAIVFLADIAKGTGLAILARVLTDDDAIHAAVAGAVVVGHIWPVLAGFRGGRGISTGLGALTGIDPWAGLAGLGVFAPIVGGTRFVSLGSVVGVLVAVGALVARAMLFEAPWAYAIFGLTAGSLIVWTHRDNIVRLAKGKERRIGQRAI
jgi:glycerol-3-phosphate acyltransferase PlsY